MEGYLILAKGFHLLDDIMTFLKQIVRMILMKKCIA